MKLMDTIIRQIDCLFVSETALLVKLSARLIDLESRQALQYYPLLSTLDLHEIVYQLKIW